MIYNQDKTGVNLRCVFVVVIVDLKEAILARVQMTVQSTLSLDGLVTELASVDECSRKVCRLNVLYQTTPVRFGLLANLATECCFAFTNIFEFLHKLREVARVALLRDVNTLELCALTIFTLG